MDQQQKPQTSPDAATTHVRDFAQEQNPLVSPPASASPNLSNERFDPNDPDGTDDMGQLPYKGGLRGPLPPRPDLTAVLSLEQYRQLATLITVIMDTMNKSLKELWDDMGNVRDTTEPRITGPSQMQASCVSFPNPFSPKYAHLFGNTPIYPEGEGIKAGATADSHDKTANEKVTAKLKPRFPKPAPILPPGMTIDDINSINAGKKPRFQPPAPILPPGITPDMLPLRMPKSMAETRSMFGGPKTDKEIMRSQATELRRDSLAHFGKFKAAVQKRIDIVLITKGGNPGNVTEPLQLSFKAPGNNNRRYASNNNPNYGHRGRLQPQQQQLVRTAVPEHPQNGSDSGIRTGTSVSDFNQVGIRHFAPFATLLKDLPKEKRACILHCTMLILLGLENYPAYARILLCYLATSLAIPLHVLSQDEFRVGKALSRIVEFITPEELQARRIEEGKTRYRRGPKPQQQQDGNGAFSTNKPSTNASTPESVGGLAAPLVSAGLSTVFKGLGVGPAAAATMLQGMAESTVVVGQLFGLYGSRATAKITESYAKDIQDFALLPVHGQKGRTAMTDPKDVPPDDRRMRITIGISGFLDPDSSDADDAMAPWRCLGDMTEVYALQWELETLGKTGAALMEVIKAPGWTQAKSDNVGTVAESLNTSTWPADLIRNSKIIDNPWAVSLVRAEKCGQILADAIMNKIGGERPVTLIGFGAGARVIWTALMMLSEKRAYGFVENAVIMGSPGPSNIQSWAAIRSVVSGRLVNVFSKNDRLMGFAQRLGNITEGVAGLEEIIGVSNVENYDVSKVVTAHIRYRYLIGPILEKLGWEDVIIKASLSQEAELRKMMDAEKERDELRAEIVAKVEAACAAEKQQEDAMNTGMTSIGSREKTAALGTKESKV